MGAGEPSEITYEAPSRDIAVAVRRLARVPVTSNTDRIFPFQALLPASATGLRQDSKAQAEQVSSIAVERLGAILGRAPADVMAQLDDALRLHLQL